MHTCRIYIHVHVRAHFHTFIRHLACLKVDRRGRISRFNPDNTWFHFRRGAKVIFPDLWTSKIRLWHSQSDWLLYVQVFLITWYVGMNGSVLPCKHKAMWEWRAFKSFDRSAPIASMPPVMPWTQLGKKILALFVPCSHGRIILSYGDLYCIYGQKFIPLDISAMQRLGKVFVHTVKICGHTVRHL